MKKLCILSATLAFAAAPAMAIAKATPLSGPYIGVYGGYDWTELDAPATSPDLDGWDGGVFVGYKMDKFMGSDKGIGATAAFEAFYGISNADDTVAGTEFEKGDEWGVSFRPGISLFDNTASGINPYGILGYRNTEFEGGAAIGSERYHGFELGLGTELIAMNNVGVRAEYAHTWYADENSVDPDSDDVRLGLSLHF